ncbi:MAG: hypothetical protein EPN91_08550 [Salinibacterium sp.]|nr:MAG: hypothetical protein EPN91_08550 [Salinibacterium sp.]
MSTNLQHFGLGNVAAMVGLQPSNLKRYAALAAGGVGGVMGSDFVQSQLLPRVGVRVPVKWAPLFTALFGVMGGTFATRKLHMPNIGTGMLVGGLAVGASAAISMLLAPAVVATTDSGQPVAGLGFGRVFSRGVRGLGLGRVPGNPMLFGAGTPNMAGARMFNGATVAIEQPGLLQGATVAIEPSNRFAAALT